MMQLPHFMREGSKMGFEEESFDRLRQLVSEILQEAINLEME